MLICLYNERGKVLNYFDKETNIIACFQNVECSSVYFPFETDDAVRVFQSIHDANQWENWIDSSAKDAPPPDFYNDKFQYMMDVMRVDDHARKNHKGKQYNPTLAHDNELFKEIKESGILEKVSDDNLHIIGHTQLPTIEDHNYLYYRKNFKRVVGGHKQKISLYRKNHQGYKVIFLICDEASAYFQVEENYNYIKEPALGDIVLGRPHLYFQDKAFLECFIESEIDYLIWYTPYKFLNSTIGVIDLPKVCVFDLTCKDYKGIEYCEKYMISSEI